MSMDPFLAEMYGTATTIGAAPASDDIEKLAQAKFIDSLAREEEGVSYDDLAPEVIVKVASEIFGEGSLLKTAEDVKEAKPEKEEEDEEEEEEESEEKKTAALQEKIAEADFLGRVMAHSNVQEHALIEKEAGIGSWAKAPLETFKGLRSGRKMHAGGKEIKDWSRARAALETVKRHPGQAAAAAGTAATPLAALAALKKGKEKKGSDINAMVEARAYEMLKEAGYVQEEDPQAEFEKVAEARALQMLAEAGYDVEEMQKQAELDYAVEMRAFEMLKEAGYPVEE
jgi:hypothetical protein